VGKGQAFCQLFSFSISLSLSFSLFELLFLGVYLCAITQYFILWHDFSYRVYQLMSSKLKGDQNIVTDIPIDYNFVIVIVIAHRHRPVIVFSVPLSLYLSRKRKQPGNARPVSYMVASYVQVVPHYAYKQLPHLFLSLSLSLSLSLFLFLPSSLPTLPFAISLCPARATCSPLKGCM